MANSIGQGLHHTPTGTCHGRLVFYDFWVCGNKLLLPAASLLVAVVVGEGEWLLLSVPELTARALLPASRLGVLCTLPPAAAAAVDTAFPAAAPLLLCDEPCLALREVDLF
jgi:hypothetical protein